ncbi:MAG: hypothetical protein ACRC1H_16385, partial [Caldilineaceae bacterium]
MLPLTGQWQDADQSGGAFLNYWRESNRLASPEYFLPPGIPYNACMANGGCPATLLDQIYNHTYPVEVFYYKVERVDNGPLTRIVLRQRGKGGSAVLESTGGTADAAPWGLSQAPRVDAPDALEASAPEATILPPLATPAPDSASGRRVHLPIIKRSLVAEDEPDQPDGCPCGWFDSTGRMYDFIP